MLSEHDFPVLRARMPLQTNQQPSSAMLFVNEIVKVLVRSTSSPFPSSPEPYKVPVPPNPGEYCDSHSMTLGGDPSFGNCIRRRWWWWWLSIRERESTLSRVCRVFRQSTKQCWTRKAQLKEPRVMATNGGRRRQMAVRPSKPGFYLFSDAGGALSLLAKRNARGFLKRSWIGR